MPCTWGGGAWRRGRPPRRRHHAGPGRHHGRGRRWGRASDRAATSSPRATSTRSGGVVRARGARHHDLGEPFARPARRGAWSALTLRSLDARGRRRRVHDVHAGVLLPPWSAATRPARPCSCGVTGRARRPCPVPVATGPGDAAARRRRGGARGGVAPSDRGCREGPRRRARRRGDQGLHVGRGACGARRGALRHRGELRRRAPGQGGALSEPSRATTRTPRRRARRRVGTTSERCSAGGCATLAPVVSWWQTLSRAVEGETIAAHAPGATVLVEVETTADPGPQRLSPRRRCRRSWRRCGSRASTCAVS